MAWNEPGNNNNGDNGRDNDPWGNNKNRGGRNQGPPDLDEVFNKLMLEQELIWLDMQLVENNIKSSELSLKNFVPQRRPHHDE